MSVCYRLSIEYYLLFCAEVITKRIRLGSIKRGLLIIIAETFMKLNIVDGEKWCYMSWALKS